MLRGVAGLIYSSVSSCRSSYLCEITPLSSLSDVYEPDCRFRYAGKHASAAQTVVLSYQINPYLRRRSGNEMNHLPRL